MTFTYGQPDLLDAFDREYVRYENETYLIEPSLVGDAGTRVLRVEQFDPGDDGE